MISVPLHSGWSLRALAGPVPDHISGIDIPATVPGSAHTDLLDAGLIADPYVGLAEKSLSWAHTTDWAYSTSFEAQRATDGERVDLAFDGLDTVATVILNGVEVARTRNQHRYYRFDVTDVVRDGDNSLEVQFGSALNFAQAEADRIGLRPRAYDHPFNMVRKMACSFGWDWGPDLQTAGIWKPVRLERWSVVRATSTRTLVTVGDSGVGRVEVHVDLQWSDVPSDDSAGVVLSASLDGGSLGGNVVGTVAVASGVTSAVVVLELPDAPLWWPAGYGAQPLFELTAQLVQDDVIRGEYQRRVGFRTVEVNTVPDEYGTPFTVRINGMDVFIKGANWIPDDHLLTRITRAQLEARADQALAANMNLLRIWGGGVYESEDFYDVCDERGLLVWQDFLLACAAYPEEEPFLEEFAAEARDNVSRLTPHASLIIWNGGNENLWGFEDWGWQEELDGKTWGLKVYTEVFAQTVAELDPTRFYSDGSPYSPGFTEELRGGTSRVHPNDQQHGTRHEWEVWNRQDYLTHLEYVPRLCSEFGHQGPPTWSTLARSVSESGRTKESEEFLLHQKAESGNLKLDKGAAPHMPLPTDFEEWNWVTQLSQAHSVAFGIEHFRSFWPYCAGSIVWQLNDCWPVTSWAAVDGDGREKPLFYALKHAYAPRMLTFKPRSRDANLVGLGGVVGAGDGAVVAALGAGFGENLTSGRSALGVPTLFVHNDHAEQWTGAITLSRQTISGEVLAMQKAVVDISPRGVGSVELDDLLLAVGDNTTEVIVANFDGYRAFHYFAEQKDLALDRNCVSWDVGIVDNNVVITVAASSLTVDIAVVPDRIHPDLVVDDQLVTLLAGETACFTLSLRNPVGRKDGIGQLALQPQSSDEIAELARKALADRALARVVIRTTNTVEA